MQKFRKSKISENFWEQNSVGMDQEEIIQELPERLKEKARLELNETDENKHEAIEQLRVSALWELRVWGTIWNPDFIIKNQNLFLAMCIKRNSFWSKTTFWNFSVGNFSLDKSFIRIKWFVEIVNPLKIMIENKKIFTESTAFFGKCKGI